MSGPLYNLRRCAEVRQLPRSAGIAADSHERQEAGHVCDLLVLEQGAQHLAAVAGALHEVLGLAVPGQQAVAALGDVHLEGLSGAPVLRVQRGRGSHLRDVGAGHAAHEGVALVELQLVEALRLVHLEAAGLDHRVRGVAAAEDASHLVLALQLLQQHPVADGIQQEPDGGVGPRGRRAAHDDEAPDAQVAHRARRLDQAGVVHVLRQGLAARVGGREHHGRGARDRGRDRGRVGHVRLGHLHIVGRPSRGR
mmetsp:Transcript_29223/g.74290  ORF Transcript_29223/g.74290 Transcript_29223/m.74290 type:complete len:252 (-) Transcript_29223:36-791(-)